MSYSPEKIKQINKLSDWLLKYGIEVDQKGFARCPFHHEKTASFKVYPSDTFYCFGCGVSGDVIKLVMLMEGITFNEACSRLDGEISYAEQRKIDRIKREKKKEAEQRNKSKDEYWKAFEDFKNNETVIELFKPKTPDEEPSIEFLTALKYRAYFSHLLDCAEIAKGV